MVPLTRPQRSVWPPKAAPDTSVSLCTLTVLDGGGPRPFIHPLPVAPGWPGDVRAPLTSTSRCGCSLWASGRAAQKGSFFPRENDAPQLWALLTTVALLPHLRKGLLQRLLAKVPVAKNTSSSELLVLGYKQGYRLLVINCFPTVTPSFSKLIFTESTEIIVHLSGITVRLWYWWS